MIKRPSPEIVALVRRCVERFVGMQAVDRAVALASLGFTAIVPLFVIVGAVLPGDRGLADALVNRFHLRGSSADLVRQVVAQPDATKQALSWLGVALLIVSALSFTRALQRVYEQSWRLEALGARGTPAGLVWIAGIVVWIALFAAARRALIDATGPVVALIVVLAGNGVLWLATPYVLLSRRLRWRALVPTAALTTIAMTVLSAASVIYMPNAIDESAARYGPIGIAIALLSWLVAIGFVLVTSAAVGAELVAGRAGAPTTSARAG
ncbi:MAG: rane protein [Solirubrobacterales bacterium]|nr:rane protein [Solirubrobacterales bacterium]